MSEHLRGKLNKKNRLLEFIEEYPQCGIPKDYIMFVGNKELKDLGIYAESLLDKYMRAIDWIVEFDIVSASQKEVKKASPDEVARIMDKMKEELRGRVCKGSVTFLPKTKATIGIEETIARLKLELEPCKTDNAMLNYAMLEENVELVNNYTSTYIYLKPKAFVKFAKAFGGRKEAKAWWELEVRCVLNKKYEGMTTEAEWNKTVDMLLSRVD